MNLILFPLDVDHVSLFTCFYASTCGIKNRAAAIDKVIDNIVMFLINRYIYNIITIVINRIEFEICCCKKI